jgi:hypothetical protein
VFANCQPFRRSVVLGSPSRSPHSALVRGSVSGGTPGPRCSFSQLRDDIVDARVWSGIHFRFGDEEGAKIGRRVAHWGARHAFR